MADPRGKVYLKRFVQYLVIETNPVHSNIYHVTFTIPDHSNQYIENGLYLSIISILLLNSL